MKADAKESEGARLERACFRSRLRRMIGYYGMGHLASGVLGVELDWILERQKRYDKKPTTNS